MTILILASVLIGFGLGLGIIVGYALGRRARARGTQEGFPVLPAAESAPKDL